MDIQIFYNSLNSEEKEKLYNLMIKCKDFHEPILIQDFIKIHPEMDAKMYNMLKTSQEIYTYIHELKIEEVIRFRSIGRKTWDKFIKMRGY